MKNIYATSLAMAGLLYAHAPAFAFNFENDSGSVRGSFDSTVSLGTGIRTKSPNCGLVLAGASGNDAPTGCLSTTSGLYDQGDLNYKQGSAFTTYLKGTHELVLKFPEQITFMARGTWLRDLSATSTSGIESAANSGQTSSGLTSQARDELRFKARLLDLWVSKNFQIGERTVRARLGNQVINWGESLFLNGGLNQTNALDLQRLSMPGTQIKEGLLPAPMLSLATGLTEQVNVEAYYQFKWNSSYLPPVGSYWSTTSALGSGSTAFGASENGARNGGQWGLSVRWQPNNFPINFGAYAMNYHDKLPVLSLNQTTFASQWKYLEDRKLFGVSANMPVGDWAVGTELSYRPKDAVALNTAAGCAARNGQCWIENQRWQWNINGIYALTPSNSGSFLKAVGASTGNLLLEFAVTHYPGLKDQYDGDYLAAGYGGYGQEYSASDTPTLGGTKTSSGLAVDFSLTYDGTLIEGWQVTPEIYYYQGISGRTPSLSAQFMRGAKSLNLALNFASNPAKWQITANYARFMGGASPLDNPLADRDYVSLVVSRTF